MSGNVVRRNVMCWSAPASAAYQCVVGWEDRILAEADWNLIWHDGHRPRVSIRGWPTEGSWERWLAGGRDTHSLIAEPRFVDPANDDYRLRPDSLAFKLGFEALPIDRMGLVESPERASWPVTEPKVDRDPPPAPPPSPPPPDMPIGRAYETATPPAIDGGMRAEEWGGDAISSRALVVERLADGSGVTPGLARVSALWDRDHLYVGMANAILGATAVELRMQAQSQDAPTRVSTFRGLRSGELETPACKGLAYAAQVRGRHWTCEWRIPFRACGIDISRTDVLRFNVRVRRPPSQPSVVWFAGSEGEADAFLVLSPSASVTAPNLLVNGDFEAGASAPTAWSVAERFDRDLPAGATRPRCLWVKEGRNGSGCLKLEAPDPRAMGVSECWWHQLIKTPAPGTYVMTYDVRTLAIRSRGELGRFYACGWAAMKKGVTPRGLNLGYSPENRIEHGRAPRWTRRECILDVPAETQTLHLIFGIKHATGTVWIDNVRLEQRDEPGESEMD